jgi:curved DNA-binding protein CbpA
MTYYEILGVTPAATSEEIRKAYQSRIAEFQNGEQNGGVTERRRSELREAYATLSNETSRDIYFNLLSKDDRRRKASGLELKASKGFGFLFTMAGLGYLFLGIASLLLCVVVTGLNMGKACWFQADSPYLVLVSKENDPLHFWFSFSTLLMIGLLFARFSVMTLTRVIKQSSRD